MVTKTQDLGSRLIDSLNLRQSQPRRVISGQNLYSHLIIYISFINDYLQFTHSQLIIKNKIAAVHEEAFNNVSLDSGCSSREKKT